MTHPHNGYDADHPSSDPAEATIAALRDILQARLPQHGQVAVSGVLGETVGESFREAFEGSELLVQFQGDVARALAQALTPAAVDEAIVEAVADLVYPVAPQLQFETLDEFVTGYIARVYRRDVVHGREHLWCPRWFEHEPAVVTLTGLWLSFEVLRNDPGTGPAVWQRDYLLPLMNALTSPSGPLVGCKATEHRALLPPLPCDPTPSGLFDTTPTEVSDAVAAHTTPPHSADGGQTVAARTDPPAPSLSTAAASNRV